MTRKPAFTVLLLSVLLCAAPCGAQTFSWQDRSLSPAQRADSLLRALTLEQKVSLMMNKSAAVPELGIKEYEWWNEALHGAARAGLATVFPQAIAMASSWDDELLREVFTIASTEQRIKFCQDRRERGGTRRYHGLTVWTPNINIFRDPRWGRGQETYGEDPYLTYRMGRAVVEGLQGSPDIQGRDKLHACLKHYAVHRGPETTRHEFNADGVSWRDLMETYFYAFERIVRTTDVQEVMCAYNRVDGRPCCGSDMLLTQLLRGSWGFSGLVTSDCGAIDDFYSPTGHHTHPDAASASANAVRSGTDLECGSSYSHLLEAVEQGKISESDIDTSLRRLLVARFRLGEMDPDSTVSWNHYPDSLLDCGAHRKVALAMARESIVLLQNDGTLPLSPGTAVCVMGPNADDSETPLGNYNGTPAHTITPLEGIRSRFTLDKDAQTVIYVGGINPRIEGEEIKGLQMEGFLGGDRTSIELPRTQRSEVDSLVRAGRKVIFVNMSGSAMGLLPESRSCSAILQAWYGGEAAGEALAQILCGEVCPSGKLPVTFYRSDEDLPDFSDYDMAGRTYRYFSGKPLWAFGHGLSYTVFSYGRPRFRKGELRVRVRNTGSRDAVEVVQVYVSKDEDAGGARLSLRGFKRVSIPAGRSVRVRIPLSDQAFETFDIASGTLKASPGHFTIGCGGSSDELRTIKVHRKGRKKAESQGQRISFANPVLYADFSDPDAIRVGQDYWMTASSFNCSPGLQILHSRDLVHWSLEGAALPGGPESYWKDSRPRPQAVQHGNGVWAPAIRFHDGLYWIFWGDPDYGIYQVHSCDPRGGWSDPVQVIEGKGYIDPCPLWDEDGRVWLVHAWANSRCGVKSVLHLCELNSDCTGCISDQRMIFDGRTNGNETVEGPKFYKKDGYYWIFAPAGGVKTGWQLVMRSRNIEGPYEWKVAMHQGGTRVCGPHQGAWIQDTEGGDWFLHFEDRYAWGRVVHLQPMEWTADNWCVIGSDEDSDGIGEPVRYASVPSPERAGSAGRGGRLKGEEPAAALQKQGQDSAPQDCRNLWERSDLKLRKIQGPETVLQTTVKSSGKGRHGLVVLGTDYATIEVCASTIRQTVCFGADKGGEESIVAQVSAPGRKVWLKVEIREGTETGKSPSDIPALCTFSYSADGRTFLPLGETFEARAGRWIGAKAGFF